MGLEFMSKIKIYKKFLYIFLGAVGFSFGAVSQPEVRAAAHDIGVAAAGSGAGAGAGATDSHPTRPVFDLVIVGGGISGLTAALTVHEHRPTARIALVEARDRLGGRMFTHEGIDMGAESVDSDHETMLTLARKLKVPLMDRGLEGKVFSIGPEEDHIRDEAQLLTVISSLVRKLESYLATKPDYLSDEADGTDAFPSAAKIEGLTPPESALLHAVYFDEDGTDLPISISDVFSTIEDLKDYIAILKRKLSIVGRVQLKFTKFKYRFKGGTIKMIEALLKALPKDWVHLGCPVTVIRREDGGSYVVETEKGDFKAKAVFISAPFSTLRSEYGILDASLGLSESLKKAIDTLTYGTNAKIAFKTKGHIRVPYALDLTKEFDMWTQPMGCIAMLGGEKGRTIAETSPLVNRVRQNVAKYFRGQSFSLKEPPLIKNWYEDPYARGSYANHTTTKTPVSEEYAPGTLEGIRKMGDPLNDGTLYFIGEHIPLDGGCMNGGAYSGQTAALHWVASSSS